MRYVLFTVLVATSGAAQTLGDCTIRTIVGPAATDAGDGGPAAQALLHDPAGMAQDVTGAIYIADSANQKIRKVLPDGTITTFAGTGIIGSSGDGGPATSASLYAPTGATIGPDGSLYFAEPSSHRVRRVRPDGTISTVAGTGAPGFGGDGGTASAATLNFPSAVATDPDGNLYFADSQNNRVRRVDAVTGVITTYAGTGSLPNGSVTDLKADGAPASTVQLGGVQDIATDADGNLFIAAIDAIVRITPDGIFHVVAGQRDGSKRNPSDGDSALATAVLAGRVAVDNAGNVYFSQSSSISGSFPGIWSVDADGILHRVSSTNANSLAFTSLGLLASISSSVDLVTSSGLQPFAGAGLSGFSGDGGPGLAARLISPLGLALDSAGNLYIADLGGYRIRKLAIDGTITTVAGSGTLGSSGDGGPATAASFYPSEIAVDADGNIFIADLFNRVRKVDTSGVISTYAGNGGRGQALSFTDGQPAISTAISPSRIAADGKGNLYILDQVARVLWKVTPDGGVHILSSLPFFTAGSLAIATDPGDNVYIAYGQIYKVAGDGTLEEWKAASQLSAGGTFGLYPIAVDSQGALYGNLYPTPLVRLSGEGPVETYLRSPNPGMSANDGPAISSIAGVGGIALDSVGNIFISDSSASRIRMIPAGCQPAVLPLVLGNVHNAWN